MHPLIRTGQNDSARKRVSRAVRDRLRLATNASRALPDFVIVGAQKCGTTSLHKALVQHPRIVRPLVKEVHFFDRHWVEGLDWYRSHFPLRAALGGRITGESSPSYMFHPLAPQRLQQVVPGAKLILLMRDPVKRAYSHYQMKQRRVGLEDKPFLEALQCEEQRLAGELDKTLADPAYQSLPRRHWSYLARGRYLEQVQAMQAHFPAEQLLILRSEDLFKDAASVLARVGAFLGVDDLARIELPRSNSGGSYTPMPEDARQFLVEYYKPHNEALYEHLGQRLWD